MSLLITCPQCGHQHRVREQPLSTNAYKESLLDELAKVPVAKPDTSSPPDVVHPADAVEPHYYKLLELETILDTSRATLKRWVKERKIDAVKLGDGGGGTPWYVSAPALEKFKRSRTFRRSSTKP